MKARKKVYLGGGVDMWAGGWGRVARARSIQDAGLSHQNPKAWLILGCHFLPWGATRLGILALGSASGYVLAAAVNPVGGKE